MAGGSVISATRGSRTGSIDYVRFLRRRARRLLPGLALVLVAILAAAMVFETAGRRRTVAIDVVSSALQVSNWRLILAQESYFARVGAPSPIRHTWSLGVQEQFYVLFPLVLLLIFAVLRGYRAMIRAFAGLALLSLGLMIWLYDPGTDPSRVYFGTGTRLFELLVGVIGAILLHRRAKRSLRRPHPGQPRGWRRGTEETFGWLGLGALALLANKPLMKAGDMSYSLYLWHWPVIVYLVPIMRTPPSWPGRSRPSSSRSPSRPSATPSSRTPSTAAACAGSCRVVRGSASVSRPSAHPLSSSVPSPWPRHRPWPRPPASS